jgi:urease accessory protein
MFVNVSPSRVSGTPTLPPSIRAEGRLSLVAARTRGRNAVSHLAELGPLRVRFPRIRDADRVEGVFINTAGGIAGGDRLQYEVETTEQASLAVTTQAAEKIYRAASEAAQVDVALRAGAGSRLSWLPQETIVFDRTRLKRALFAEIASDAVLTICEAVVFGRAAMGERVENGSFEDCWRIKRGGKLIFADTARLGGKIDATLTQKAVASGQVCFATILHVASDADLLLNPVRESLGDDREAGASAFEGMLIVRMLSGDSFSLRRKILNVLLALGAPPPRAFSL